MITPVNPVGSFLAGREARQQEQAGQQTMQMNQQTMAGRQQQMQIQQQQQQAAVRQEIGQALQWADTPEKWDQAVGFFEQQGMKEAGQYRGRFDLRPMLAEQVGLNLPAQTQHFEHLARAGGFSDEERGQAARVAAGLQARPSSAGAKVVKMTGSDGRERAYVQQADGSLIPASEQIIGQAGGMSSIPSMGAPQGQMGGVSVDTSRRPEDAPPANMEWRGEGPDRRLVPIQGSEAQRDTDRARRTRAQMFRGRVEPFVRDAQRAIGLVESAGPFAGAIATPGEGAGTIRRMLAAGLTPDTFELNQHLESLKSNISIEQLQQMREASPTGGALGQIPVRQQEFLMQMEGALSPQLQPEVLRENIAYVSNNRIRALAQATYGDDEELMEAVMDGRMTAQEAEEAAAERDELIRLNLQDQQFQLRGGSSNGRTQQPQADNTPRAVNPQTGEVLILRNGQWVPDNG